MIEFIGKRESPDVPRCFGRVDCDIYSLLIWLLAADLRIRQAQSNVRGRIMQDILHYHQ